MNWIDLAEDKSRLRAFVNAVMHFLVRKMRNIFTSGEPVSFLRWTLLHGESNL